MSVSHCGTLGMRLERSIRAHWLIALNAGLRKYVNLIDKWKSLSIYTEDGKMRVMFEK